MDFPSQVCCLIYGLDGIWGSQLSDVLAAVALNEGNVCIFYCLSDWGVLPHLTSCSAWGITPNKGSSQIQHLTQLGMKCPVGQSWR